MSAALWATFVAVWPYEFASVDVYHFKDAACNLAAGLGFKSASYVGSDSFQPKVWFSQGPLYPLLYSGWAYAFGCDAAPNGIFNFLTGSFLFFAVAYAVYSLSYFWRPALYALWPLLLVLPTGGYGLIDDRPDHLALGLVVISFTGFQRATTPLARYACWLTAGLAFVTSPYYGLLAGALIILVAVSTDSPRYRIGQLMAGAGIAALPPIICLIAYAAIDWTSVERFLRHSSIVLTADQSYLEKLRHAFFSSGQVSIVYSLKMTLSLLIFLAVFIVAERATSHPSSLRVAAGGSIFLILLTAIAFPRQTAYFAAVALATGLMLFRCVIQSARNDRLRIAYCVAWIVITAGTLVPIQAVAMLKRIETSDTFKMQKSFVASDDTLAAARGRVWVVPATAYFVYKNQNAALIDPGHLFPNYPHDAVAVVVVCRGGHQELHRSFRKIVEIEEEDYGLVRTPVDGVRLHLFQRVIGRSFWDFGCDHYVKRRQR